MSSSNYARGPCAHSQCTQALGGCAAFVIVVNDTLREYALSADERCSACLHPWFSHRVGALELDGRPALFHRGGCVSFQCGGFVMPADGGTANWDTACACGGPLRAHSISTSGAGHAPTIVTPQVAPVQFATTHPALSPVLPLGARAPLDAAALASAPPIEAYNGMREEEGGSAWDRCRASAERTRVAIAAQRGNVSRVRSTTSRVTAPAPAASAGPASAAPARTSGSGEGHGAIASQPDPTVKVFSVLMLPFQHPSTENCRGSYPRREWVWTPEQFDNIVHQAILYELMFTVTLAREGPVWLSFHNQVMEFCRRHHIHVPGFEPSVTPRTPSSLPFILLKSANKKKPMGAKIHSLFDDLTCTTFTVDNLLGTKFLITPPYPGPEEQFAPHPLLRIAPRRGDLSANLMRSDLWTSDTPGMLDYLHIPAPYDPHPCFPSRVMCVVGPDVVPRCRLDCPTERARSREASPVAGPSGTQHAESPPSMRATSPSFSADVNHLPSPTLVASPGPSVLASVGPSLSALQLSGILDDNDFASTTSTPLGSPTDVWRDLPPRMTSRRTEAAAVGEDRAREVTTPSGSMATAPVPGPANDAVRLLDIAPASDVAVTPASPLSDELPVALRPAAVPVSSQAPDGLDRDQAGSPAASGEVIPFDPTPTQQTRKRQHSVGVIPHNSSPPGSSHVSASAVDVVHMGEDTLVADPVALPLGSQSIAGVEDPEGAVEVEQRPSNRRRTHSPVLPILRNPYIRSARALRPVPEAAVQRWTSRVLSVLSPAADFSHPIPHIRAPDMEMASDILIFLVEWLVEKQPVGPSADAEDAFAEAFAARFPHSHAECTLTTLPRLIRHGARLDLRVGDAIGSSPVRSLLRLCIQKLVGDERYWKVVGRYRCTFIRLIDPELYEHLVPWAEYEWGTPLPSDPCHPLITLIFSAGVDVKVFSDPPRHAELEWMERHLVAQALFDGTELASDASGLAAFRRGMHMAIASGHTLDETFLFNCRDYLAVMCSVRLDDVSLLIRHIEFKSALDLRAAEQQSAHSEIMPNVTWDVIFEDAFKERLTAYLKGRGHPDHPDVREVVGQEVFLRDQGDPLLRARLFLQMMSGSDLVPPEGDWKLKIFFRHVGRREPLPEGEALDHIHPINVHACFYDCTVTIDEGVRILLREENGGLLFEVWLHGAVLDPNDYNQI
ncbi:hypothetical protein K466DRAFT_603651 [Polyporus arcularius HHB13444]|uniref:Uncharacterized protein n=1 Tax=Polyporus arcularius HHB13444 TaxID=1314778 RepID=A0A5C3NYM9_9APHY|nr:hypothetical protein K466DRAFT_603651 [Polyporus arcularius HHB13444]